MTEYEEGFEHDWDPMKLTNEQARQVVQEDTWRFEIVEDEISDHRRWSVSHACIFRDRKTGKHYQVTYDVGATEKQDERPFEYTDPDPVEVEKVEVTVTQWKVVK